MDITYHYPPELLNLLIDTIPKLCRSKEDTLNFLRGAGVSDANLADLYAQVRANPKGISKYHIVRTVLVRLNEHGEPGLRERRETLRRVVEFESYDACWPNDVLEAKGRVAEVRRIVDVKDSFTRMNIERQREVETRRQEYLDKQKVASARRDAFDSVRTDLCALFAMTDATKRGKALEGVLNRLFKVDGILVRESFTVSGERGDGVIEQVDGVIQFDGHLFLVEMKWHKEPLGPPPVGHHLSRLFGRADARALLISASGYTVAGVETAKQALALKVVVLSELSEFITILESHANLAEFLRRKVEAATIDRNPYFIGSGT